MWVTLPPVVAVATAADELAGVSMVAHTAGMMYESNMNSCPPPTAGPITGNRASMLGASPAMTPHNASQVCGDHPAPASDPQCGHSNRAALLPPVIIGGALCEPSAPPAAGAWSRQAPPGSHSTQHLLRQLHHERHSFHPLASPPSSGTSAPIATPAAACAGSVSAASQDAVASIGQDARGGGLSKSPRASFSTGAAAVGTCRCASLPCVCTPSTGQVQLLSSSPEQHIVPLAAGRPAGGASYASAMMPSSGPLYAVPKATAPTNTAAAMAPALTTHGPDASHAALRPFIDSSKDQLTASATATASGEVGALREAAASYGARNPQTPAPLVGEPRRTPFVSALTPTPHSSATPSGDVPQDSSLCVSSSVNLRGGTGGSGGPNSSLRTPSLEPLLTTSSPPMRVREHVPLRNQYAPQPSVWGVGATSLDTRGTAFTVSTTGMMSASLSQTPPRPQLLTYAQLGNSGSARDVGHLHVQSPSTTCASPPRHPPSPIHPSWTSSGTESAGAGAGMPSLPPDDTFSTAAPTNHSQSFYMGTTGNENLRRSFFFPLNQPGSAAWAPDGVEDSSLMSAGGGELQCDMTPYVLPPAATYGRPLGQANQSTTATGDSGVTVYGVGDAGLPSDACSVLPDPYRSPMMPEALPLQSLSQGPHGQDPSHEPQLQAQQSLPLTPAASASALPMPAPQLTIFSRSPQAASLHGAPPGLAQPLRVSQTSVRGMHSSLCQPPAQQQQFASDLSSSSAVGVPAVEVNGNAAIANSSFLSPMLADLQWQRRFEESLSVTENTLTHTHSSSQTTGCGVATPAAGGDCNGTNERSPPAASNAKVIPRPAYIVDWEQSLTAFQNRAESYYSFKNGCTETYLALVEHCVDRFLVCYFSGGIIRPEKSLQEALASHTGAATSTSIRVFSGNGACSLQAKGPIGAGAGGGGIQKVLPSSKTLQRLGETGSKWLTKIGANLRRSTAASAQVSREPQGPPMSAGPASQGTAAFAGTVAQSHRGVEDGSTNSQITPKTIGAAGTATRGREREELPGTFASAHDATTFRVSATPSAAPGRLPSPRILGSITSTSATPPLLGSPLPYTGATTETSSAASTKAAALSAHVALEEAEMQCLRQLGPYVANVVPETFMDVRPSDGVLDQVRRNYTILTHALQHVLLDDNGRTERIANAPSSDADPGLTPPATLTHTLSPTLSTWLLSSPLPTTMDELVFQRIRRGLLLPTIQATWRDYLAPLQCKVQELTQIAKASIDPILEELQAPCGASVTDGDSSVSLMAAEISERGLQHESIAAPTALTNRASAPFNAMTDAERAAREALRTAWVVPISRLIRLLRRDEEYLATIHVMDDGFVEYGAAWRELSAQMRLRGAALSNYVPVYGLVLSRLHRLEMEHRTVLELWGGGAAGAQYRLHV
ncbi:hypothetical protein GH5_05411 [Leishmania sp. Ghana 2012 LV757]|uniref:hypothetical protein n=1 Tax=Leishmania sp. Ghana 2012 LV757 TaxID=2803181 RepID=UPI001B68C467|nr:hypothetical protein GH5_05411 [Leishmania sp. Ghana 2012 LV757]